MMKFYLKVNLELHFSFRCVQYWIDVAHKYGGGVIFVCDKSSLKKSIIERCHFYESPKWMPSSYTALKNCVDGFYDEYWYKAGYAHLTSFFDATENDNERFWNIDADDTLPCIVPEKMVMLLRQAETYAEKKDLDIFSLDMHESRTNHYHFSYGISYIRSSKKVFGFYKNTDKNWKTWKAIGSANVDWYATYLRDTGKIRVQSFYAENLWFIHFGLLYNFELALHGLYHFTRGKVYLPLYDSLGDGKMYFSIHSDVVRFDLGITDGENLKNVKEMLFCLIPAFNFFNYSCKYKKQPLQVIQKSIQNDGVLITIKKCIRKILQIR